MTPPDYACRHCGDRHLKPVPAKESMLTYPPIKLCGCGVGRPHLACEKDLT